MAQDNRVSLRINYLFSFKDKGSINDTIQKYNDHAFQILPSLGLYHTFKNNVGVGIELGYRDSKYIENSTYKLENTAIISYSTNQNLYTSYFFCPSVYETFYFKNYIANLSFTIPIEYISKFANYQESNRIDGQTNNSIRHIEYTKWPRILLYALYLQGGLYRKIYKGLYIGAELAIGPSFQSRFGKGEGYSKEFTDGLLVQEKPITYKSESHTQVRLVSLPTISIQYRFTKKK